MDAYIHNTFEAVSRLTERPEKLRLLFFHEKKNQKSLFIANIILRIVF